MNDKITAVNNSLYAGFGGSSTSICQTIQGTTTDSRVGRDIIIKRVELNYRAVINSTACNVIEQPRVMVLYDKYANGVNATNTEILELPGAAVTGESMRFINFGNMSRFVVLYDRLWSLPAYTFPALQYTETGGGGTAEDQYVGRIDLDVALPATYVDGSITPTSGNIIIFVTGSTFQATAALAKWSIEFYARVTFIDN